VLRCERLLEGALLLDGALEGALLEGAREYGTARRGDSIPLRSEKDTLDRLDTGLESALLLLLMLLPNTSLLPLLRTSLGRWSPTRKWLWFSTSPCESPSPPRTPRSSCSSRRGD
jgi:hypothetical protein